MIAQTSLPNVDAEIAEDRDAWTTPPAIWSIPIVAFRGTRFDLDPCSNNQATVRAAVTIEPPADGLAVPWSELVPRGGTVWLNPPFSSVEPWFQRAAEAAEAGLLVWGVVPYAPHIGAWRRRGPDWFWSLGRVAFVPPPGVRPSSPQQEHALVLWGEVPAWVMGAVDADRSTLYRARRCPC